MRYTIRLITACVKSGIDGFIDGLRDAESRRQREAVDKLYEDRASVKNINKKDLANSYAKLHARTREVENEDALEVLGELKASLFSPPLADRWDCKLTVTRDGVYSKISTAGQTPAEAIVRCRNIFNNMSKEGWKKKW